MKNIALIGNGLHSYHHVLADYGFEVQRFNATEKLLKKAASIDLIIISRDSKASPKDLLKGTRDIPKLLIDSEYSSRGLITWLKNPMTYYLCKPTQKEFMQFIKRIEADKKLFNENRKLTEANIMLGKEIDFFNEITRMLTASFELDDVLEFIMHKVKTITNAQLSSIFLLDEETGELVLEKGKGKWSKKPGKIRVKQGEGIAGWVAKEGAPLVVPDVSMDKRFMDKTDGKSFKPKSLMCVPIKSKGNVLGVVEVINKYDNEPFGMDDLNTFSRLVDQTAFAVERGILHQKMEELIITDDLTKLFNSRYLDRTIETEISRSKRYRTSVSVIFMDVDFFKNVNDYYGHLIGSKLLVEMAQLLIRQLRNVDIVARYGGDEFVLILPQTPPKEAAATAERIRKAIEQFTFLKKDGYNLKLTASFGVSSYPESAKSKEDLLRLADEAMYKVKHRTRNGVYAII